MKPPIHKDGDNAIISKEQLLLVQDKRSAFATAVQAEATTNADGDYVLPHRRVLELLKSPMANPEWPTAFKPLKLLAKPEDKGLGDIIARTIGPVGGNAFKAWYLQAFGKPCGCTARQTALNKRYPL